MANDTLGLIITIIILFIWLYFKSEKFKNIVDNRILKKNDTYIKK